MAQDIVDQDAFTDPVVEPVDGDVRNAASVQVPFRALANRTRRLKNRIDGLNVDADFLAKIYHWTGEHIFDKWLVAKGFGASDEDLGFYYVSIQHRTKLVPLTHGRPRGEFDAPKNWALDNSNTGNPYWTVQPGGSVRVLTFSLDLPRGSYLTGVRVGYSQTVDGNSSQLKIRAYKHTYAMGTTPSDGTATPLGNTYTSPGAGRAIALIDGFEASNDPTYSEIVVVIESCDTSTALAYDCVYWVEAQYIFQMIMGD